LKRGFFVYVELMNSLAIIISHEE
jgi:hypothetical protein